MITSLTATITHRDRAVLRAVAAGRCTVSLEGGTALRIDGLLFADQFAGERLTRAGLIDAPGTALAPARLTACGKSLLAAA